jgi:predicted DsbA family dithiol-disulfide isomerase
VKSDHDVEVVWRAFELRPEPVPTLDPNGDYLQRAWSTSVYPLAESLGITMKLPPVQPRTRRAHEAAHWSRSQGHFDDYHAEIFRALFERGEDIGKVDVLASLALKSGLDSEALREALETREFEKSVLKDEGAAVRLGVTGVPAFIANKRATLGGVRPVEHLRQLISHVRGSDEDQPAVRRL